MKTSIVFLFLSISCATTPNLERAIETSHEHSPELTDPMTEVPPKPDPEVMPLRSCPDAGCPYIPNVPLDDDGAGLHCIIPHVMDAACFCVPEGSAPDLWCKLADWQLDILLADG